MNLIAILITLVKLTLAMPASNMENDSVGFVKLDKQTLDVFEEKAYDYDDGAEIAHYYAPTLLHLFLGKDPQSSDQAARILGICLRNNFEAATAISENTNDLPNYIHLDRRGIKLLSALVSTSPGRELVESHNTISKFQSELAQITTDKDPQIATEVSKLLRTLSTSGVDGEVWCKWVDALQQAYYNTHNEQFKTLAVEIVSKDTDFSTITTTCKLQPGIDEQADVKRSVETESAMAHKFAARGHFDDL